MVIRRFATYRNPQRGVIGAWSHGYLNHGSPYSTPRGKLRPHLTELWQEALEYFDYYLKGKGNPAIGEKRLFYYTLGKGAWQVTDAPAVGGRAGGPTPANGIGHAGRRVQIRCKAPRHSRQPRQRGICKLQILRSLNEFEYHSLRQPSLA